MAKQRTGEYKPKDHIKKKESNKPSERQNLLNLKKGSIVKLHKDLEREKLRRKTEVPNIFSKNKKK
jgi:hypothetical protein